MKIKTIQQHYIDVPDEEKTVLFLLLNGWKKIENMPKYIKHGKLVNVKFMQDLVAIVADVEQTDSYSITQMIAECKANA
ncbi:MAG: hypothetical protein HGB12_14205 [Bacteroidetes bacterium]|nr:hypothetical protein [Bacteroidota bacterium]